ncbi:MAG: hypothetical protein KUG72_02045 [Pseudomonadales bacterium]|nr:hypothetical protein [Pseudomonadales bacterium]
MKHGRVKSQENLQSSAVFACLILLLSGLLPHASLAGDREQAKRIHDRIAGIPPSQAVLDTMEGLVAGGDAIGAADVAMENPAFYSVTLKNLVTPWTNESQTVFAGLNDYTATVIGIVRENYDFRRILYDDILFVANPALGLTPYSRTSNAHYEQIEEQNVDLSSNAGLIETTQSAVTGIPASAAAGVTTTRAAAKAFFIDGTNRAMFRFTLLNQLCTDLEAIKDVSRASDRIPRDVSRSPGGDSRIFLNACMGCHTGMDPMNQAFAYYDFEHDVTADPEGNDGQLVYNDVGEIDAVTGTRVQEKYHFNKDTFSSGYISLDDSWDNYWREGPNAALGWADSAPLGSGNGAKSMGQELANSDAFASCQVKKVFKAVCLRPAVDATDRAQLASMTSSFKSNDYNLKQVFSESAVYCMGE